MLNIEFTGNFWTFFFASIGLAILTICTLGLAAPYAVYWTTKYFFTRLKVGNRHFQFTGGFGEYFLMSLALFILTVLTVGILAPYYAYWNVKYFASRLQIPKAQ